MKVLGKFTQTVEEKKKYTLDYSQWLDTGETLSSVTSGVDRTTTPPLVVTDPVNTATAVTFFVSGGEAGQNYKVVIEVITSIGQEKEDAISFAIRDFTP